MSSINNITIGNIITDKEAGSSYRIIYVSVNDIVLCEMNTTKFILITMSYMQIMDLLQEQGFTISEDKGLVFDENHLSENIRAKYIRNRDMMNEVVAAYGPTFIELGGKYKKTRLYEIMRKYECPKNTFWRICTKYFQSGCKSYSLVDNKAWGNTKGKENDYTIKPGRPSEYVKSSIVVKDEVREHFEDALSNYKKGRNKSFRSAFDWMNCKYYSETKIVNGVTTVGLMPESQRPTYNQFYYYCRKHITEQEIDLIKTSAAEQRNNKRLITSDSLHGVLGPGDMVEIDACEADVSLVSTTDSNKTIGRPVVYFMIDIYTRAIIAMSVAFDNNSILGVTNLFLNLADNKKEYCSRYGMGFGDDAIWPSNIKPRRIRVDRGSEFKSKEFRRICNELGIELQIVSGASGSLKGVVEQSFHQMHSRQNEHLEDNGLIEKRYDSNHHKEATLNIEQYTKMVINFVLMHNQQYDKNYPLTREMMDKKIQPIPAILWKYGANKIEPSRIPDKDQYLYTLMTPVNAKLSRRGISYNGLWYLAKDDKQLSKEMFRAGTKKVPFEVRMDKRSVGAVYYIRNGKLIKASLNEMITGNIDFAGLTEKEWNDYRKSKHQLDAHGRIQNEELSAFNYLVNQEIVGSAQKDTYSDKKNMRVTRELEKQKVSHDNNIEQRLQNEETKTLPEKDGEKILVKEKTKQKKKPKSFQEAIEMYFD